jgi:uncharacterized protein
MVSPRYWRDFISVCELKIDFFPFGRFMSTTLTASAKEVFATRLTTLEHLLNAASVHFSEEADVCMSKRITADMHTLGTQIAFTCNQPRNSSRWLSGQEASDLDPRVESLGQALATIRETKGLLCLVTADDTVLSTNKRLALGEGIYADLTGHQYLNDFFIPNFYFHLVTAYAILRMSGVQIGKRDYMPHLIPYVKQVDA